MPLDTSIYNNLKPVEMPSYLDSATKASNLSSLAMNQARGVKQMAQEDQEAKLKAHMQKASLFGNALDSISGMAEPERAQAYTKVRQELVGSGVVSPQDMPEQYDPTYYRSTLDRFYKSKEHIDKQLAQTQLAKAQADLDPRDRDLERRYKQAQIAELHAKANSKGILATKPLPADKVLSVNEGNAIPKQLKDIEETIAANKGSFGPVKGRYESWNPWNDKAQTMQSQIKAASQSFGRFMEGGVLRKEDEVKYEKMFPQQSDTPEVAANKLAIVNRLLADRQNSNIAALKAQGYNVAGVDQGVQSSDVPAILRGGKEGSSAIPSAQASDGSETRVVNGAVYVKVKGGWKRL